MKNTYEGYKNHKTWNVALWINNDESLYKIALEVKKNNGDYRDFVLILHDLGIDNTPDGIYFGDRELDFNILDELIKEL